MAQRLLSRKFLMALSALVVCLLVIMKPAKADQIQSQAKDITACVTAVLAAAGYIGVEGALDHKALDGPPDPPPATPVSVPSAGGGK